MVKPGRPDHDSIYRLLFGDPRIVAELIRDFLGSPWIDGLDLERMTRLNATFRSLMGDRRESDLIWRIPRREGGDAYVVLLLELQSSADHWMALRVLTYTALLWEHLVHERQVPDRKVPAIIPVVLYNRDARWTSPVTVRDLVALPDGATLWPYQPVMRYNVIDEGAYTAKDLETRNNLVSLVFRLENSPDPVQAVEVADAAIAWFSGHPGFQTARKILTQMLGTVAPYDADVPVPDDLVEVRNMLATRMERWTQDLLAQGEQRGRQEGRQEGEAAILLRLLERRFGPLPDQTRARVKAADSALLEEWSLRVLDAGSLVDVLTDRRA